MRLPLALHLLSVWLKRPESGLSRGRSQANGAPVLLLASHALDQAHP